MCSTQCQWENQGICDGNGVCTQGDTKPCGDKCGVQVCNNQCQWLACINEGACVAGTIQYGKAAQCNACQQKKCTAQCQWPSLCEVTAESECSPGDEQPCGSGGVKFCAPGGGTGGIHCNWTECYDFNIP